MTKKPPAGEETSLAWDEQGQPYSRQFGDVYFSKASGIDESRYVFIDHNHLPERFAALTPGDQFIIGETGFGTGLNFLACWLCWQQCAPAIGASLHFVSAEKYPLTRQQLHQALTLWPELAQLAEQLEAAYPPMPTQGFQRMTFDQGRVQLTLILDDAAEGLQQLLPLPASVRFPQTTAAHPSWAGRELTFDAWFLDGFAPAKNPDMWTPKLFQTLAQLSTSNTSFATFTAAGIVKRGLQDVGFEVSKVPGFGRKRHMLHGAFTGKAPTLAMPETGTRSALGALPSTWHVVPTSSSPGAAAREALIIGAGLAGCHTARALAERGYHVTVLEADRLASGASGNPQGVVYAKASSQNQPLTNFNLAALQFACHFYGSRIGFANCGAQSGVFYLAQNAKQQAEYRALAELYHHEPQFVRWLDRQAASDACGLPMAAGGLLFSQAGWLRPQDLCSSLLDHPDIELIEHAPVAELQQELDGWKAIGQHGATLAQAPAVVLANANQVTQLPQLAHLPLKAIRGQVSQVPATALTQKLQHVVCGKGYVAPATEHDGGELHCLGATFNLGSSDPNANPDDDLENLDQVAELSASFNEWRLNPGRVTGSRVAFRCTTPDYLPVVGPAPIAADMASRFAAFRYNAQRSVDQPGSFYSGLYVNVGHGSRGLAYTPLCAEILASMISGAPLPVSHDMALRLHPARFLIRDLKRNRR